MLFHAEQSTTRVLRRISYDTPHSNAGALQFHLVGVFTINLHFFVMHQRSFCLITHRFAKMSVLFLSFPDISCSKTGSSFRKFRFAKCDHHFPPRACASEIDKKHLQIDFDRDYYDKLKAEYANDPYINIYSKNDYTLDPKDVPWLYENRGRNLDDVREKVKRRLKYRAENPDYRPPADEEEGHHDAPPDALIWTDLHSDEEIAQFSTRALTEDPVGGRVWTTPMTPSELKNMNEQYEQPAKAFLHLDDDDPASKLPITDGDQFWEAAETPLPGNLYADENDEIAALHRSWDQMQDQIDASRKDETMTFGEMDPLPDPDEYERWKREAEKRGGNATVGDSHFLSPYTPNPAVDKKNVLPKPSYNEPPQHDSLVRAHSGLWKGTVTLYHLEFNNKMQHSITMTTPAQSEAIHNNDDSLEFHFSVQNGDEEILSSVEFSTAESGNLINCGRGVNHDGSYILIPPKGGFTGGGFSIGAKTLAKLSGGFQNKPVVEFCLFSRQPTRIRHRVFLFADGMRPSIDMDAKPQALASQKSPNFSAVMVISEATCTLREWNHPVNPQLNWEIPNVPLSSLLGQWAGSGISVHPEYFLESCRSIETSFSMSKSEQITVSDVTWTEEQTPEDLERPKKRIVKQENGKKPSKRVMAARNHDQRRLSSCSVLSQEQTGKENIEDIHGWEVSPSASAVTSLFSPRIGRFIDDYCGLILCKNLVLTLPYKKAFPTKWNVISVIEIGSPSRTRLLAGRSPEGLLVGALFTKERKKDGEEGDSVALYV